MDPASLSCVWLTTLRPDGSPHTAPVWFVLQRGADNRAGTEATAGTVYVATSRDTVKTRNLGLDPRVSLAFDQTGPDPWVAEGSAVVHDPIDRTLWSDVLAAFAAKHGGWDAADETYYGPRVLLEITVDRWLLRPDVG